METGASEPGEIGLRTGILRPDAAVVTAIGEEHLDRLGTVGGVLEEETAILRGLGAQGVAFVAEEPPELARRARHAVRSFAV